MQQAETTTAFVEPDSIEDAHARLAKLDEEVAEIRREIDRREIDADVGRITEDVYQAWLARARGARKFAHDERNLILAWIKRASSAQKREAAKETQRITLETAKLAAELKKKLRAEHHASEQEALARRQQLAALGETVPIQHLWELYVRAADALATIQAAGVELPHDAASLIRQAEDAVPREFARAKRDAAACGRAAVDAAAKAAAHRAVKIERAEYLVRLRGRAYNVAVGGAEFDAIDVADAVAVAAGHPACHDLQIFAKRAARLQDEQNRLERFALVRRERKAAEKGGRDDG